MKSVSIDYEIPFFDVDAYRIVWHGNYPKYFEIARCYLLEDVGCPYAEMEQQGFFFPVVDLQIKYIKPLVFNQKIKIQTTLAEWQHKLVIKYVIIDKETGEVLTKAKTTQFAISMPNHITQFESPKFLLDYVERWLKKDS